MSDDINTVTLSAVIQGDVETYRTDDLPMSRFYFIIQRAREPGKACAFKVVAFGDLAEAIMRNLHQGSQSSSGGAARVAKKPTARRSWPHERLSRIL